MFSHSHRAAFTAGVHVFVGFVATAVTLMGQSREERLDAVREFQAYFKRHRETAQRVEAIKTLDRAECPEAAAILVDLLDDREPAIAQASAEVLGKYTDSSTFERFIAELPEMRKSDQQARLIRVLGVARQKNAATAFRLVLQQDRVDEEVRVAVARALETVGGAESKDLVVRLLGDEQARVRLAAADTAGALRLEQVGPQLVHLFDDKSWQVQVAAVQAVGAVRLRDRESIERLISLMERSDGRLDEECADALFRIFAQDFGLDEEKWRRNWDRLKAIEGWRPPTDEELAKAAASRKKYDALYGKTTEGKSFARIRTNSNAIVFVIDISGSMEDLVVNTEQFEGAGYADFSKLTIVKTELSNAVDSLDATTSFNILAFARDRKPWKRFLVPANNVNKASAKRWIQKLTVVGASSASSAADLAAGKTNTYSALMFPFGVDPEKKKGPKTGASVQNVIDTVFFLSDGRPTAGQKVDVEEILADVFRLNEEYRLCFNTIAIGEFQASFLERLALETGGTFVDMGR